MSEPTISMLANVDTSILDKPGISTSCLAIADAILKSNDDVEKEIQKISEILLALCLASDQRKAMRNLLDGT